MSYSISTKTGGERVYSAIVGGSVFKRIYRDCTESEMLRQFKAEIKKIRGIA